jgi:hypothetical protein
MHLLSLTDCISKDITRKKRKKKTMSRTHTDIT